ncbi:MAG: dihydroorotate dehydrogenase electron transfer subunit [Anaerolineae bacterium]
MRTSLPRVAHIVEARDENGRVRTLVLDLELEAGPGQFVMAWLPGVDEKPFSLVAARPVTLAVARVGPFTEQVFRLGVGDRLWIRGPLGRPFRLPERGGRDEEAGLLLVGGGYGVAPMHFLARRARAAGWPVTVVVGARTAADVVYVDRFRALGARVVVTTDDGSLGERGLAPDAARRLLGEEAYCAVYACGPEPMLAALEALARAQGIAGQLSYERYMRCGLGVCGSCARQGWLVCRDGPVRDIEQASSQG